MTTQLKFKYRAFGSGIQDLEVQVEANGLGKTVWSEAPLNQEWQEATVNVCVEEDNFVVSFCWNTIALFDQHYNY